MTKSEKLEEKYFLKHELGRKVSMQRYHIKQSEGIEMKWMKILRNKKGKLE